MTLSGAYVAPRILLIEAAPFPGIGCDVSTFRFAAGVRFLASIREGHGLKPSARAAGIGKETGYRWLREAFLTFRRQGLNSQAAQNELGFSSTHVTEWEGTAEGFVDSLTCPRSKCQSNLQQSHQRTSYARAPKNPRAADDPVGHRIAWRKGSRKFPSHPVTPRIALILQADCTPITYALKLIMKDPRMSA
jgi:hypothetical protein